MGLLCLSQVASEGPRGSASSVCSSVVPFQGWAEQEWFIFWPKDQIKTMKHITHCSHCCKGRNRTLASWMLALPTSKCWSWTSSPEWCWGHWRGALHALQGPLLCIFFIQHTIMEGSCHAPCTGLGAGDSFIVHSVCVRVEVRGGWWMRNRQYSGDGDS